MYAYPGDAPAAFPGVKLEDEDGSDAFPEVVRWSPNPPPPLVEADVTQSERAAVSTSKDVKGKGKAVARPKKRDLTGKGKARATTEG